MEEEEGREAPHFLAHLSPKGASCLLEATLSTPGFPACSRALVRVLSRCICWGCILSSQIKELGALGIWTPSTPNHLGTLDIAPSQRVLLSAEQALLDSQRPGPRPDHIMS